MMARLRVPFSLEQPVARANVPAWADSVEGAAAALKQFVGAGRVCVLTGAGLSTDSGIPDYRGKEGTYTTNTRYRPIFYSEFVGRHAARQRYFARSFVGFPPVLRARPNPGHEACAALLRTSTATAIVTQNVDSLHSHSDPELAVTELHGTLRTVECLTCRTTMLRRDFQHTLAQLNPLWADLLARMEAGGAEMKTNADGDVELTDAPYETFRYPACQRCLRAGRGEADPDGAAVGSMFGILKPSVTFFGESVREETRVQAEEAVRACGRLLVVGSSLATYSAFRLVKLARELGRPLGILNLGASRVRAEMAGDILLQHPITPTLQRLCAHLDIRLPPVPIRKPPSTLPR